MEQFIHKRIKRYHKRKEVIASFLCTLAFAREQKEEVKANCVKLTVNVSELHF